MNIAIAQGIVYTILGHEDVHDGSENTTTSDDTFANPHCDDAILTEFLNGIITAVSDPHPFSRNSSAIWLLALVKNLSKRSCVYKRKQVLQYAFTELLSDDSGKTSGKKIVFGILTKKKNS